MKVQILFCEPCIYRYLVCSEPKTGDTRVNTNMFVRMEVCLLTGLYENVAFCSCMELLFAENQKRN